MSETVRFQRSDRPNGLVGRYVATGLFAGRSLRSDRLVCGSIATFDESTEINARFHRKVLHEDSFTKNTFRKSVHADFYGYLDVTFVVSVLTPTVSPPRPLESRIVAEILVAPACVANFLSFREKLARRKAEKEPVHADTELPSSSVLVVTPNHEPEVQVPQDAGAQVETGVLCVLDALAQPSGSSTTPILVEGKEKAAESMPPPTARKEIVLALRALSATPVVQPKGRKRKCTMGNDGESLQQEGLSLTSGFRGKFVSLIDGMISECGFELEVQIGELERDIGKTASSLLKEKIARKTKSSEVSRLQRRIESGEGSANRGVEEAKDALRVEFQTRLAKISDFLGSLECIRSRDLALATVDGGMALVQALQGKNPSSLQAEEARSSACQGDLAAVDGSFDLILADLKSECFLPTCSEDPEGQDPAVGENGGGAAPSMDEAMGEGEV
ncbi:hypothetical protein DY000_02021336 [Brassica cretica]|uniref:MATH domain-containing protein n=1 Tax=Brassica cretica TaxID=69181 RepID=A0ABQ7E3Q6_BRACR|nr:hypothetical protein DY000_02021336 [Brassica cretica]